MYPQAKGAEQGVEARLQAGAAEPRLAGRRLGAETLCVSSCTPGRAATTSTSSSDAWLGAKVAENNQFCKCLSSYLPTLFGDLHIISVKCKILPFHSKINLFFSTFII